MRKITAIVFMVIAVMFLIPAIFFYALSMLIKGEDDEYKTKEGNDV